MGIAGGGDCSSRTCWVHFATWTLLWMQRWLTGCLPPRPLLMNWLGHPAPSICPHPQAPLYWFITTRTHSALPLSSEVAQLFTWCFDKMRKARWRTIPGHCVYVRWYHRWV